jgi:hypothetical protein
MTEKKVGEVKLNYPDNMRIDYSEQLHTLFIYANADDQMLDITDECKAELQSAGPGKYIMITYQGRDIARYDALGGKLISLDVGYRIERAEGTSIAVRIYKTL